MINVYSANETNFNHNGLATLNPLSTDFSVEVNGNWVLTLVLPWDREKKYTYVEKNNIIIADINCIREQVAKRQKFRIYDYKKNYNTITVKACPVAFEATFDVPITNLSLVGENGKISGVEAVSRIQDYVDGVVVDKYTITTDVTKTAKADYTNSNLIKAIASSDDNSFINTWGGEVAYDNYDIKIKTALGDQDNASAYPIVYGKNITGVEYGIDVSNVVTRIYPISSDDMRLNAWNDLDATGKSTQQYVDGNTSAYPYIRSAFLVVDRAELIDTNSKSISDTRTHTLAWQEGIINKVRTVAKTLWQEVKKNEDQRFSPEYVQELIPDIVNYVQARYTFSHKGWQSFIKSCIKQGIEWIKDEEIAEWGWKGDYGAWWYGENSEIYAHDQYVLINKVYEYFNDEGFWQDWCRFEDADWYQTSDGTWWYGNKNDDGSTKNCAVSQYIYIYSEGKWYQFDGQGFYIDEEIPAETITLLNTYTWREDSTGWYYGDGNGNYLTSSWVESSEGKHYWVGADGYMDETKTDEQGWMWFTEPSKYRYGDYERYYAHNEYVYMTVEGQMKEWWYDKEGWYDDSKSGDSDFAWHGDGSASNPYWFGEEDAGTEDKNKYIHDKWAFIDGTYYWFDEYGYISGDASKAKQNYQWGVQTDTVTGDTWFGNPDRTYEAIYVKSQWLKIDGEWYYFGSDGYKVNMDEKKAEIIAWFGDEIYDETHEYIDDCLEEAYTYLYADMTAWANEQFTNGIDAPAVTVNVSLVDLSKTTEYKNYASFEQICLGDKVEVKALGMSFTERVVGLSYDVIRGYNTNVTIGKMGDTISSLMSTSFGSVESGGTARLIGGDGVKVDGNVISSENVAVTYGIQDATLEGVSIVHGNVARLNDIYRELTQAQYNNLSSQEKNSGKLFYITDTQTIMHKGVAYGGGSISYGTSTPTGGSDGDVYFQTDANGNIVKIWQNHSGAWGGMTGGGLEWWTETEQSFYRLGKHSQEGGDTDYLKPKNTEIGTYARGAGWRNPRVVRIDASTDDVIIGKAGSDRHWIIVVASLAPLNDFQWGNGTAGGMSPPYNVEEWYDKTTYPLSYYNGTCVYDGATWNILLIDCPYWESQTGSGCDGITSIGASYSTDASSLGLALLQASHATSTVDATASIGVGQYPFYCEIDGVIVAYIDADGNGRFSEIETDEGTLAEQLSEKQNALIEGENITIGADGKTISATDTDALADMTDVEFNNLADGQVLKYNASNQKWINGTGGGGGSEVIPNPQGTATDTLNTVEIDGTIYDFPSGGGGGSGYSETTLWENASGLSFNASNQQTVTLSDNMSNYDMLCLIYRDSTYLTDRSISMYLVSEIDTAGSVGFWLTPLMPENNLTSPRSYYVSDNQVRLVGVTGRVTMVAFKIIGIKFGGGGSGATFEGLDYSNATDLTLPNYTGYTYTPSENGVIMVSNYGGAGALVISSANFNSLFLMSASDRWTTSWCFVEKDVEYTLSRGSSSSNWNSNAWAKFIPLKQSSSGGGGSSEVNYSTNEQVIGTWIDGKPLYQITISIDGNYTGNGNVTISDIPSGIDVKTYNGILSYEESGTYKPVGIGNNYIIYPFNAFNTIRFTIGSGTFHFIGSLTIQYTKTTD